MTTTRANDSAPAAGPARTAAELREFVRAHARNRPGVYRMIGPGEQVLYVGKSIRVRSRLLSYFRADPGEKAAEILGFTERVEWDDHPSEFAALLREFRQIRRLRPPFNVQHKKERAVCFIRIPREPVARVLATTRPVDDGSEYWGPLLGAERVRAAVRVLVDALQLRDCPATTPLRLADQRELFAGDPVPLCARAELDRCLAPCARGCTERGYAARLDVARAFLRGETDEPLRRLRSLLGRAVERWLFEYAAVVQDRIELLEGVRASLLRTERALDRLTAVYTLPGHEGEDRVYLLQRGVVRAELPAPRTRVDRHRLAHRAARALGAPPPPPPRIGEDGIAEMLLVERWFRRNPEEHHRLTPA
ncbi:MAG: nuclease [Gemmatimonadetes bacterium]|nr:nuclease [Gemmatimonadota bacterium]NIQ52323.1 nuclease [Gemmatimonadota bacterium]NIU72431.1 nuclease [Gammaproteobacteria bacterium]NIX42891.1 nuclease [Gemmatimonadota bacterium]NIY08830.1 nuclease [Gemmatimonadota bacterium]